MYKPLLIAYLIVLFALLSSCFFNPFEKFQMGYPRGETPPTITPILTDENITYALV